MANNLSVNTKSFRVNAFATSNTTNQNSNFVDMQGADGVVFLSEFGTAATQNYIQVQQATATGASTSSLATTLTRNVTDYRTDVYRPSNRYVRLHQNRGSSSELQSVWAITYNLTEDSATATSQQGQFFNTPT